MTPTYATPAASAIGSVRARLHPSPHGYSHNEFVEFLIGEVSYGLAVLPHAAAHDLISRLEDTPATLNLIDASVAGHVRWWLDNDYRDDADEPDEWTAELIELIVHADEERRRHIGRGYPGYVVCVAIATGQGGLDELRRLHQELIASGARTATPSG